MKKKCKRCGCPFTTAIDERKLCRSCQKEVKTEHVESDN